MLADRLMTQVTDTDVNVVLVRFMHTFMHWHSVSCLKTLGHAAKRGLGF